MSSRRRLGLPTWRSPPAGSPSGPGFGNVFVNPSSYRVFLQTGKWPDGTIFILEGRASSTEGSINKGGHYQSDVAAVEAAVKDESRFPKKWAYFGFGRSDKGAPFPATSVCNSCHSQNAAVENTFVQFYPTLLEIARRKGTLNPAYLRKSEERPDQPEAHAPAPR